MAKFYVCQTNAGEPFDCVRTFAEAKDRVRSIGGGEVISMEITMDWESIAKILDGRGGFSKTVTTHFIKP